MKDTCKRITFMVTPEMEVMLEMAEMVANTEEAEELVDLLLLSSMLTQVLVVN